MSTDKIKIIFLYLLTCLIWGTTWFTIRISLQSFTPIFSAGFRFLVACFLILALIKINNKKIQTDSTSIKLYFLMGFFSFVIPFGLVYWGQQYIPSGLASVLFSVYPFFVVIFSRFLFSEEKITSSKIIGMIISFAGIIIIFSKNITMDFSNTYFLGMLAILLSSFMQSIIAVSIKKYGHHLDPLSMNFVPMFIGGFSMLMIGFLIEDFSKNNFNFNGIASVLYLGIFGSVITFTSYYWLLKRISIIFLSLIAFVTPVVALFVGWIFIDEKLLIHHFIGSSFVLIGILVANIFLLNIKKNK